MSKKVRPIKPGDVICEKSKSIPPEVIEVFNELIVKEFRGGSARIIQDDAIKLILEKGITLGNLLGNGWLDVEPIFRKNGWKVEYDKPGYNEEYKAFFVFSVK